MHSLACFIEKECYTRKKLEECNARVLSELAMPNAGTHQSSTRLQLTPDKNYYQRQMQECIQLHPWQP
jgi:hypothetical protein